MKKSLSLFISLIITSTTLFSCGKLDDVPIVLPTAGQDIPNPGTETPAESDKLPSPPETPLEQEPANPPAHPQKHLYATVLDIYETGVNSDGEIIDSCEYAFHDIDSNGIAELILRYEKYWIDGFAIYTYADGKIHKLGDYWPASELHAVDNDGFIYSNKDRRTDSLFEAIRISDEKAEFITVESWRWLNGECFHSADGFERIIEQIEYMTLFNEVRSRSILEDLEWQPLYVNPDGNDPQPESLGDILYKGEISLSLLFEEPFTSILGIPLSVSDDCGPYYFYDGLEVQAQGDWIDENGLLQYETAVAIQLVLTEPSMFEIDEVSLHKNRAELFNELGIPIKTYRYRGNPDLFNDDDFSERMMRYHISNGTSKYVLDFWYEHPDDKVHLISIRPY